MAGYTKLDNGIITSSIWSADSDTRIVWITLLAMSDAEGLVETSIPGLARIANVSLETCEKAIAYLSSPDPYSRCKDYEGRRLEQTEGGFSILNKGTYREKDYSRADYWRNWRNKRNGCATPAQQGATPAQHNEEVRSKNEEVRMKEENIYMSISSDSLAAFEEARKTYPGTKRGRDTELSDFRRKHKDWCSIIPLLAPAVLKQIAARREASPTDFVPSWKHFKTWLWNRCWEEELKFRETIDEQVARMEREGTWKGIL